MILIFNRCYKLSSLPNISRGNTNNITNMWSMFSGCSSLSSLSDDSKLNAHIVKDMSGMLIGCKESLNIPSKFK